MKFSVIKLIFFVSILMSFNSLFAQDKISEEWHKMHASKAQSLKEFNDAKFGMFIHWGLYSKPAGIWKGEKIKGLGEWIMYHAQIPGGEYKEIAKEFNPEKFNAEEWVQLAKQAGMKYIVAMPKHHDGFAMYNSKVSDYDIVDATPFGRDPMEELYLECKKQGIRFGIYYSHSIDWMDGGDAGYAQKKKLDPNHTDSYGANLWCPSPKSYDEYIETKAKPQMQELLDMFPGLFEIWYDFPRFMNKEQSFSFYKLAYEKQPDCIINSRVGNGFGDFWIPGDNRIPEDSEAKDVYWETPGTLNNTWGIKSYDTDWKSIDELLYWITEITSKGGNYLLNVGPTDEGLFPEESIKQLKEIGAWLLINGESVYGTTKWEINHEGPFNMEMKSTDEREEKGFSAGFTAEDFWFSKKDRVIYATSLKWAESKDVLIKSFDSSMGKIKKVRLLGSKEKLQWKQDANGLKVILPVKHPHEKGYVLEITGNKQL
jgi:alpha-L-fucosidase